MRTAQTLRALDQELAAIAAPSVGSVRKVRRGVSARIRNDTPAEVLALANALTHRDRGYDRFIACELVAAHRATMDRLTAGELRKLGRGMDSWDDVDVFASYLSGPAWRESRIASAEIAKWAKSGDLWWRRAAVVSTVPLNNRARGGSGDARRTLAVCRRLLGDREPIIVKAISWSLRELSKRDPAAVRKFVAVNDGRLAPLIRREVRAKLTTGLKNPRRRPKPK